MTTKKKEKILPKLLIKQVKSISGATVNQRKSVQALGLRKIGSQVTHTGTPEVLGLIKKINHLVVVNNLEG